MEQYIKGREVQGGVLDDEALGVIEVVPAREFYDYEAKYKAGAAARSTSSPRRSRRISTSA